MVIFLLILQFIVLVKFTFQDLNAVQHRESRCTGNGKSVPSSHQNSIHYISIPCFAQFSDDLSWIISFSGSFGMPYVCPAALPNTGLQPEWREAELPRRNLAKGLLDFGVTLFPRCGELVNPSGASAWFSRCRSGSRGFRFSRTSRYRDSLGDSSGFW